MPNVTRQPPDVDDAMQFIIGYLTGTVQALDLPSYGYEFYLPNVMRAWARDAGVERPDESHTRPLSPVFYAAAWDLCRRGILRPGIRRQGEQATPDGASGNGYSVTPRGRDWLQAVGQADYIPVEPGRFARMLAERGGEFGPGFAERAQEAVRAYDGLAYLACCAMCGAAAESLILALAIAKTGNEARVVKDYMSAGGRGRVERTLLHGQPAPVEAEFRRYTDLLKYWRDSAAHGRAAHITEAEAFGSLILLLRFAIFAGEHRAELTA